MQFARPTKLGVFQLLAACLLVALLTCPGEAHGPMIILKGSHRHHGGGGMGSMGAVGLLAAGVLLKLFLEHSKNLHGGGAGGGGGGLGHHGIPMAGHSMMHSFASHDANLGKYGYTPKEHGPWLP